MEINNKELIWNFSNRLRTVVPFYGFSSTAIELFFMKYMAGFDQVYLPEDFKTIMQYQKMFITRKFDPQLTESVFLIAEKTFNIENRLLTSCIEDLIRIFNDKEDYIFAVLNDFELPLDKEVMSDLIETVLESDDGKDVSRTGYASTNSSLIKLTNAILDVKPDEVYMDSFCGFSKSSIRVNAGEYLGYELNPNVASIANMIMILTGKHNFGLKNQDFYLAQPREVADKIFSDGPIGLTLNENQYFALGGESKKGDYYTLKCTVDALKRGGRAVVTAVNGVLFRNEFKRLRESLTFRNLKAVITLPSMWSYTSVSTSLIVFENERKDNSIMMIDASGKENIDKTVKRVNKLTEESINKILSALNGEEICGFSKKVTEYEILKANQEQSWLPTHYVIKELERFEYRSVKEINDDLKEAYNDLYELMDK